MYACVYVCVYVYVCMYVYKIRELINFLIQFSPI